MSRFRRPLPLVAALLSAVLLLGGCASLTNTQKGAAIGTGAGAAAGAAIGKAAGGTAEGAIIGAVVGGTAGAIIGKRMDNKAEELDEQLENAEVERVGEGIKVTFDSGLLFEFDSSTIQGAAEENLTEFATTMRDFEESNILIVGHTDSKGPADYNQGLSERRAQSAADFITRKGISSDRIETVGKGESEPVASNDTEAGRQQNRRVEVAIYASKEYRQEVKQQAQSN
ncbi:cell envelope biogenesis protein OmpA [Salinibacter sp. 10B]|uniref:OmpA family protein n=1 Tax=Salinibacter sp. 10B TaxID=1923971 RepID=UPI000D2E96FD|nr:OmpA family protein [Salinibacter sp. 10B]PQJ36297.1 cell envelope biogenesis protein OmpA [Salinibacter sp. 10B]